MKYQNLLGIVVATALILTIPLIGMQFSDDVVWTLSDFIIAGAVLLSTGGLIELAICKAGRYKTAAVMVIVFMFLWLWAELAVGVFTNWGS